jgi:hypothetical protein
LTIEAPDEDDRQKHSETTIIDNDKQPNGSKKNDNILLNMSASATNPFSLERVTKLNPFRHFTLDKLCWPTQTKTARTHTL